MKQIRILALLLTAFLLILNFPKANAQTVNDNDVNAILQINGRHFLPKQVIKVDVRLNNHTSHLVRNRTRLQVVNQGDLEQWSTLLRIPLQANGQFHIPFMVKVPSVEGKYILRARSDGSGQQLSDNMRFDVFQPEKSKKLSKIMVFVPDYETELQKFVNNWKINAPSFTWGQCMLCSYRTWQRLMNGDNDVTATIERALRRNMSVIFLDFGPASMPDIDHQEIDLPFHIETTFDGKAKPEKNFALLSKNKEINYHLQNMENGNWNGLDGVTVPPVHMRVKVRGGTVKNLVQAGSKPFRFPVVTVSTGRGHGMVVLCQLLTDGRLLKPAGKMVAGKNGGIYDPLTVQMVLNLISMSVDNRLLQGASNQ